MKRPRTGVLGIFPHLDTATEAIRRLKEAGYEMTVYSPTPRHEIEEALDRPESAVRVFTITGAFAGTGAGAAMAIWMSLDWPLIVGGKEIVSIPAFSVIMFELTILLGALSTVAGLFILSRLPRFGRAEGLYHPACSAGHFGVFAHVPPDEYGKVQAILAESEAEEVLLDER